MADSPDRLAGQAGPGGPADGPACEPGRDLRPDVLPAPAFQRAVLRALAERSDLAAASRGPFRIRVERGPEAWDVRLDEPFRRYRHGETEPGAVALEILAAVAAPDAPISAAGPFPRLARPEDLDPETHRIPCPFDPGLCVFYVRVVPQGHVALSRTEAADWPSPEALQAAALAALAEALGDAPPVAQGAGDRRVLGFNAGDGFEAARALLPGLAESLARALPGRMHLAIPSRDLLMALGDADPAFLAGARAHVAERYDESPVRLSPRWYRLGPEGLTPVPEPDEAAED